jgi:hypothetical protein
MRQPDGAAAPNSVPITGDHVVMDDEVLVDVDGSDSEQGERPEKAQSVSGIAPWVIRNCLQASAALLLFHGSAVLGRDDVVALATSP